MVFSEQDTTQIIQEKQRTELELFNALTTISHCIRCTNELRHISTNHPGEAGRDSTVWYGDVNSYRTNNSTVQQVPTTHDKINLQEEL